MIRKLLELWPVLGLWYCDAIWNMELDNMEDIFNWVEILTTCCYSKLSCPNLAPSSSELYAGLWWVTILPKQLPSWFGRFLKHASKVFSNKRWEVLCINSTMILVSCNYTFPITYCSNKMGITSTFMTSLCSKSKIHSLIRSSPRLNFWSPGLIKWICFMCKIAPSRIISLQSKSSSVVFA